MNNPGSRSKPEVTDGSKALSRLFLISFASSCVLFWWLVSFLYRVVLDLEDPVLNRTIGLSILSFVLFVIGFGLPHPKGRFEVLSTATLNCCEALSYRLTLLLFVPACGLALVFAVVSFGKPYGQGWHIGLADQIIFYVHLFFGFLFLGAASKSDRSTNKIRLAIVLIVLPRMIVSMNYGRVFLAQGVVPIVFLAIARGWIQLSAKRMLQIAALGLFILFIPSLTRGDNVFTPGEESSPGQDVPQVVNFLAAGSSLNVTQDYLDLDLAHRCPPLLVSLTGKVIPYALLHLCTVRLFGQEIAANLDRIVTYEMHGEGDPDDVEGTGTSYLLELYLTGGLTAVVIGSLAFGFLCKSFTTSIAARSVCSGIWAECLMRAIFAPRGMLGYVFEKIPGLLLATFCVVVLSSILSHQRAGPASEKMLLSS